ncbi:MAG: Uma2 family endonuclease [Anaerolineae bacterium]
MPMPPDLAAVEVVSPGDSAKEIEEKMRDYLRHGVRLIWVMYPSLKSIIVRKPGAMTELSGEDMLEGGDVLPGFKVKVSEIFPK